MFHKTIYCRLTAPRVFAALFLLLSGMFILENTAIFAADGFSPYEVLISPGTNAARLAYVSGDWRQTREILEELSRDNPQFPAPGLLMAWLHLTYGDREQFQRCCAEVIEQLPKDPQVWYVLAESALADGRWIEASLLLERGDSILAALSDSGEFPERTRALKTDSLFLAARLAEAEGKFVSAEEKYRLLRERDPENDSYCLRLGSVLLEEEKIDEAVKLFDTAKELNRRNLPGWLLAADLLHRQGKGEKARGLVDGALSDETLGNLEITDEDSEGVSVLSDLVRLLLKWNRLDEAERWIAKIPPTLSVRRTLTGRLALFREDYPRAEMEFRQARLAGRDDFETLNGYILALAERDDARLRQACRLAEEQVKKYPRLDEAAATLGWTEFLLGETETAWKRFEPILDSGSFTPTDAYYMAEIALERGDESLCGTLLDLALGQGDYFPKYQAAVRLRDTLRGFETASEEPSAAERNTAEQDTAEQSAAEQDIAEQNTEVHRDDGAEVTDPKGESVP